MKLDRNITNPRRGKYALIKLRPQTNDAVIVNTSDATDYVPVLKSAIDYGNTEDSDFFVIRLKDKYAAAALFEYARAAAKDGETEYAAEVEHLAVAAYDHPSKRKPD